MGFLEIGELPKYEAVRKIADRIPEVNMASLDACLSVIKAADCLVDSLCGFFAQHGLSQGRFRVMMILFEDPEAELNSCEIAKRSNVTRATMTGLLDGLEKMGYVSREACSVDRRVMKVKLTEEGLSFLHRVLPGHYRNINYLMSSLTEREMKTLSRLLRKVEKKSYEFNGNGHSHEQCNSEDEF